MWWVLFTVTLINVPVLLVLTSTFQGSLTDPDEDKETSFPIFWAFGVPIIIQLIMANYYLIRTVSSDPGIIPAWVYLQPVSSVAEMPDKYKPLVTTMVN